MYLGANVEYIEVLQEHILIFDGNRLISYTKGILYAPFLFSHVDHDRINSILIHKKVFVQNILKHIHDCCIVDEELLQNDSNEINLDS